MTPKEEKKMKITLFAARFDAVVIDTETGKGIVIRDGMLPEHARLLAARLNSTVTDNEDFRGSEPA
jgi:hypothetical protein